MPVKYIPAITARYERLGYSPYRWFHADTPPPWCKIDKPLNDTRLGLLSTSGIYALGQLAFHYKEDTSIREIRTEVPDQDLRFCHTASSYLSDAYKDPNCVFPRNTLKTLVDEGFLGSLAPTAVTCMGAVYSARRARDELAPRVLEAFRKQAVDAALLVAM